MDSAIIAEVPIVDCRASVEVVFSTSPHTKDDTGFFYILNVGRPVSLESRLPSSDLRDQLQATLSGSYTLERELGGGGMSRVFVAEELRLKRKVVVKILSPELAQGISVERFEREIQTAAGLQHPNIVPLLSAGDANGVAYYTMPFVEGESLGARLATANPLSLTEIVSLLKDVARALAFAHAKGVVHRDIKPDNVLMTGGVASVIDFGIAKALSAAREGAGPLTGTGISLGTPEYMAPEQALADQTSDHRVDIYAFGCLAYELLAGKSPFHGRSLQQMVMAHVTETPVPIEEIRPDVRPELAALVARCLEKVPAKRPQSADEIVDALGAISTATYPAEPAHGTTAKRRAELRTPHNPRRIAIIGIAGALVAVLAYAGVSRWRGAANASIDSVAILPFESVGGDTANAYFAEGMADELSTALGKVPGLHVAARSSSAAVRRMGLTVGQIGARLHVRAVISGSVRRAGDRMRVHAELASVATGLAVWDSSYERRVTDVFALQDDLTRAILGTLRLRLTGADTSRGRAKGAPGTANLEAYDLYLHGMYLYNKRRSLPKAIEFFQQALAKDSSFAGAWAATALALSSLAFGGAADVADLARRADAAARRAIALDSTSSDAHTAMARAFELTGKWNAASAEHEKATALDPASSIAHHQFGRFLIQGSTQYRRGLDELQAAVRLDPLDASAAGILAVALILNGRVEEAIPVARRGVDIDSMIGPSQQGLLWATYLAGHLAAARTLALRTRNYFPNRGFNALVLARTGDTASAKEVIRQLETLPESNRSRAFNLGHAYLGLGDTAQALNYLEKAAQASYVFQGMFGLQIYDALRGSPRFGALMRAYGLDDRVLNSPRGGRP